MGLGLANPKRNATPLLVTQLLLVNDAVLPNSAFFKFPLTLAQAHWNRLKARLVASHASCIG